MVAGAINDETFVEEVRRYYRKDLEKPCYMPVEHWLNSTSEEREAVLARAYLAIVAQSDDLHKRNLDILDAWPVSRLQTIHPPTDDPT